MRGLEELIGCVDNMVLNTSTLDNESTNASFDDRMDCISGNSNTNNSRSHKNTYNVLVVEDTNKDTAFYLDGYDFSDIGIDNLIMSVCSIKEIESDRNYSSSLGYHSIIRQNNKFYIPYLLRDYIVQLCRQLNKKITSKGELVNTPMLELIYHDEDMNKIRNPHMHGIEYGSYDPTILYHVLVSDISSDRRKKIVSARIPAFTMNNNTMAQKYAQLFTGEVLLKEDVEKSGYAQAFSLSKTPNYKRRYYVLFSNGTYASLEDFCIAVCNYMDSYKIIPNLSLKELSSEVEWY